MTEESSASAGASPVPELVHVTLTNSSWQSFDGPGGVEIEDVRWILLLSRDTAQISNTVGVAEILPDGLLPAHRHTPHETYHVLSGSGRCFVDGREYRLEAGATLFIPGGSVHRTEGTGDRPLRFLFLFPTNTMEEVHYEFEPPGQAADNPVTGRAAHRTETDPDLNDEDRTPGTGMLSPVGRSDPNVQPSS